MKKKLNLFGFTAIFLILLSLGCNKYQLETENQTNNVNEAYVGIDSVRYLAQKFTKVIFGDIKSGPAEIKNIMNFKDDNYLYIVNYKDGGFIIISGDKKTFPILGFSDKGQIDTSELNENFRFWLDNAHEMVEANSQKDDSKIFWFGRVDPIPPNPDDDDNNGNGNNYTVTVGPLIKTTWGQGCGYNTYCPPGYYCQHAPTGCVATALAQIMKYYNYPPEYDWNAMMNDAPTTETARLMSDIGIHIGMHYNPDASEMRYNEVKNNVPYQLTHYFQYSSAIFKSYRNTDYTLIKNNINAHRPVFIIGVKHNEGGHAWVIDGYKETTTGGTTYLLFHMNWGWGQQYQQNAWCYYDTMNGFNQRRGIIYNIHP